METMKSNYLNLLSDRDHLLDLAVICLDALRRKEEVDNLTSELVNTKNSLETTEVALQEAENQIKELF